MFRFLCRTAPKSSRIEPHSHYLECRSWHGVTWHIRDNRDESGLTLCSYAPLDDGREVTLLDVRAAHEHAGFRYCVICVEKLEGLSHG